ncbi:MAG: hypothetical protein QME32_05120, partial [Endomicrobiia bacterium]|nr:hypothetical protein [Endomicrobiia bacterium]
MKYIRHFFTVAAINLAIVAPVFTQQKSPPQNLETKPIEYVPDEIIVKFRDLPDQHEPKYEGGIYKVGKGSLNKL